MALSVMQQVAVHHVCLVSVLRTKVERVLMSAPAEARFHAFQILPIEYILYSVFESLDTKHAMTLTLSA